MPRQSGKVDTSVHWNPCVECHRRHEPGSACPPVGVWLLLTLCPRCDGVAGRYCYEHRRSA
jgi:hypothetical protein